MSPEPNWLRLGVSSLSQPYVIVDICTKNTLIQYTTHCIWVLHMQIHLARIYKLMWSIIKPVLRGQVHSRLQQMCALEWSRPSPTSLRNTRLYHKKKQKPRCCTWSRVAATTPAAATTTITALWLQSSAVLCCSRLVGAEHRTCLR